MKRINKKQYRHAKDMFEKSWLAPENQPISAWIRQRKQAILKRDSGRCFYCDHRFTKEFPPTFEHLLSVNSGGSKHIGNLVLACEPCNLKVGSKDLIDKIKYREFRLLTKI